ncbi:MAG: exodeoxyribonuclease VII small subunit [Clostridia bacterium]|nr:exodeoxyribonuclease VII small subunit [Clostridia bacterium]
MKLEEAMKRLDEILSSLNEENIDLEAAMKLYEEGVRTVAFCQKKLAEAERKISLLKITADGELVEAPFEVERTEA